MTVTNYEAKRYNEMRSLAFNRRRLQDHKKMVADVLAKKGKTK